MLSPSLSSTINSRHQLERRLLLLEEQNVQRPYVWKEREGCIPLILTNATCL